MRKCLSLIVACLAALAASTYASDSRVDNVVDPYGNMFLQFVAPSATAVNNCVLQNAATANNPVIKVVGSDTNVSLVLQGKGTGSVQLNDGSGNAVLTATKTATAVNNVNLTNNATGAAPLVGVAGTDSNIQLRLSSKGTAQVATDNAMLIQNATAGGMSGSTPFFPTTAAASATVTAAQLQSGMYVVTGSATTTITLPTAALIVAANPGCKVNDIIYWDVRNEASTTTTVAVGTGITSEAGNTLTIATLNTRRFALLITNVGTPAIQLFSLGVSAH